MKEQDLIDLGFKKEIELGNKIIKKITIYKYAISKHTRN
jgi:hypothetical protein